MKYRRLLAFAPIGMAAVAMAGSAALASLPFPTAHPLAARATYSSTRAEAVPSASPTASSTIQGSTTDKPPASSSPVPPRPVPTLVATRAPTPPPPVPSHAPPPASWPGPTSTGVPAGTRLTPSGYLTVTTPGAVVDAMDVTGCILVQASNVTIKRTRVRVGSPTGFCGGQIIQVAEGVSRVLIEDVEVDGQNINAEYAAVSGGGGWTCLRCNVHNAGDGFNAWGTNPITIQDSWVHDLYIRDDLGSHNQDIFTNGFAAGFVIRHNTLENWDGQTATIALFADFSPVQNVTVDNNLLNGGGYCVYGAANDGKPYTSQTRNIVFTNNHFGRKFYPNCGFWGPTAYVEPALPGSAWSGNVWDGTTTPITP